MKALILEDKNKLTLKEVPAPEKASPGHLIIKMEASAINSGDKLFIAGAFPRGIPLSRYSVAGVSGTGTVIGAGKNVPEIYLGRRVTIYRSLKSSEEAIGTWSEYAHLHYLNCAILPGSVTAEEYSGSLVNTITPYSYLKQVIKDEHKGIICTAGNSATGKAMLGICIKYGFPLISIVRTEKGKKELESLGAENIIVHQDTHFKDMLQELSQQIRSTAIFDGVGGNLLTEIIDNIPYNSTISAYGFLDQQFQLSFSTKVLMKGITIKGFSNFRTDTVLDENKLEQALQDLSSFIHMPHFKTRVGKTFTFEDEGSALDFTSPDGKAVLLV